MVSNGPWEEALSGKPLNFYLTNGVIFNCLKNVGIIIEVFESIFIYFSARVGSCCPPPNPTLKEHGSDSV